MPGDAAAGRSRDPVTYSPAQRQRLAELQPSGQPEIGEFVDAGERDRCFEQARLELTRQNLARLEVLRTQTRRPVVRRLEAMVVEVLIDQGFVEVTTPLLIAKGTLERVGLDESHPLWHQVYWLDRTRCLRPMLAPNLYRLMSHLQRLWPFPMGLFEVGPCFRKESKGASHLSEFTMLNLVELGPEGSAAGRLEELAERVMAAVGLPYELVERRSDVYGATLDIAVNGLEVASGVAGPNPLDAHWEIVDPWAGWGFGLERLAMALEGSVQIGRFGRSLAYLDGARLNIQAERPQSPAE